MKCLKLPLLKRELRGRFLDSPRVLNRLKTKTRGGFPVKARNGPLTDRTILLASGILGIENPLTLVLWEQRNALYAQMAEQVDASASKADVFGVRVRVSLWAPCRFRFFDRLV